MYMERPSDDSPADIFIVRAQKGKLCASKRPKSAYRFLRYADSILLILFQKRIVRLGEKSGKGGKGVGAVYILCCTF